MISIYLFTKKFQFIFNKLFDSTLLVFNFSFEESYLHLFYQNNLLQTIFIYKKMIFIYLC